MPYSYKFSILDIYIYNVFLIEEPTPRNPCQSTKIGCTVRPPGGSSCAARRCIHIWVPPKFSNTEFHPNFPITVPAFILTCFYIHTPYKVHTIFILQSILD